ncbi:MAG: hypothetical protein Q4B79_07265 [Moraxella sp.]|uniref:hypothetical protein n=1 Tax=Moraxella sp. TaxID=479 RepID=UPI0026DC8AAD|nr:hypothetical protein [Moraxella sp.]MDO4450737.1 hypothetical protein [Moraxella sp.]
MFSVRDFIKNEVVPLLILDVIVLFFALLEPISFGLSIRSGLPFFENISTVFLFVSFICIPYFLIWSVIYFFIYILYNKTQKRESLIPLVSIVAFVLKVLMGFFIFGFLQISRT